MEILSYKAIIIEDERASRNRLKHLLKKHEKIELICECTDGEAGVVKINELRPEVIFLDIAMPGLNGFEMLRKLDYKPWVIFTTAFDQYAIQAFEENSIDYLLKPVDEERFDLAIQKLFYFGQKGKQNNLDDLDKAVEKINPQKELSFIPVKLNNTILLIRLEQIAYFEAKEKYVLLNTADCEQYILSLTLSVLEEKLPAYFIRIHRSCIVNMHYVSQLKRNSHRTYELIINDKKQSRLINSPQYLDRIKSLLQI